LKTRAVLAFTLSVLVATLARAQPASVIDPVRDAYRGSIAERVVVNVVATDGTSAAAGFEWSVDRSGESGVIRLDLGRLQIEVASGVLSAVHRHHPRTVYRLTIDAGNPMGSIAAVLPPLPVPQLAWALAALSASSESDEAGVPAVASIHLMAGMPALSTDSFRSSVPGVFEAKLEGGWSAVLTAREGGAHGISKVSLIDSEEVQRLGITATLLTGPLARLALADREPVASIHDLRPAAADIPIGSTLPTPGLMNRGFEPWSLSETFASATSAGIGPMYAILVVFDATRETSIGDAASAHRACVDAVRVLRQRAKWGELESGAFILMPVAMLPVEGFAQAGIATAQERWSKAAEEGGEPVAEPVWSSAGPRFVSRLVPGSGAAVIVLDASQTVLASIPVDARRLERDAVRVEVEAVLAERLRPIEVP